MSKNPVTSRLKAVLLGAVGAITLISLTGPRSGGVYTLPSGNPVSTGTAISSTVHNNTMSDIATALTQSLSKDGQTTVTGNIPFGGFKATNVADATARNQWAGAGQVQDGSLVLAGSVSGTDTITAALNPAITSYATGMTITFLPASNNTGATTIALNGLAAKNILKWDGDALVSGDLVSGLPATITYNGGSFYLQNPQSGIFSNVQYFPDGSAAAPSISFGADGNTGVYRGGADTLSFTAGGVEKFQINSSGIINVEPIKSIDGAVSAPAYTFVNDTNTGLYRDTADSVSISAGGTSILTARAGFVDINTGVFRVANGSAGAPTLTYFNDTNTGIYLAAGDDLGVSVGGTRRLRIAGDQIEARDGSASNPAFSFMDDGNNGMYRIGTDNIGLSAGGTKILDATASVFNITSTSAQVNGVDINVKNTLGVSTANSDYTFALGDAWTAKYHSGAPTQTWTVPPSSSVAFPTGTVIYVAVSSGGGAITVAPGVGVTLYGVGSVGSRTVGAGYIAMLLKVATDTWLISGAGVS